MSSFIDKALMAFIHRQEIWEVSFDFFERLTLDFPKSPSAHMEVIGDQIFRIAVEPPADDGELFRADAQLAEFQKKLLNLIESFVFFAAPHIRFGARHWNPFSFGSIKRE
jgi:hypothetical protein